jgi:hypothetical protein
MPPGVEQFVGLLDFAKIGYKNLDTGALRFVFDFLQVGGLVISCCCSIASVLFDTRTLDSDVVLSLSLLLNKSCAENKDSW